MFPRGGTYNIFGTVCGADHKGILFAFNSPNKGIFFGQSPSKGPNCGQISVKCPTKGTIFP